MQFFVVLNDAQAQCLDRNNVLVVFFTRIDSTGGKIGRFSHDEHHLTSQLREIYVFKDYKASRRKTVEEILLHEE
jgi:hypothetical protein